MKRSTIVPVSLSIVVFSLFITAMAGTVAAQRPGRPTPVATLDRSGSSGKRTPIATPDAAQPTRQHPGAGTPVATFSLPLNLTLTPRGTLPVPGTSDEAALVINSFAGTYLGTTYDFTYAGAITGDKSYPKWDAFVAKLPANIQSYISAFTGAAGGSYWGLFKSGMGMTAIGDCTSNPNCTITMDNLNLYLTSASSGVYSVYTTGTAASATDALNLLYATYPTLAAIPLQPVTTSQGFAFQAVGTSIDVSSQLTATSRIYLAGVVPSGTQLLIYTVVGIGDGYVSMIQ